jgi:hypothetical protein
VDLTLVIPPKSDPDGLGADPETAAQVGVELEQAVTECLEKDLVCAMPRLAAEIFYSASTKGSDSEEITALIEDLAEKGVTRLIGTGDILHKETLVQLESLAATAASHFMPVTLSVDKSALPDEAMEERVTLWIGTGATGLLAWPQMVPSLKERVRELSYAECREVLRQRLMQVEEGV